MVITRWVLITALLFQSAAVAVPVWSEEFNTPGPPSASTWSYDLGAGSDGSAQAQSSSGSEAPFSACVTAIASSLVYSGSGDCDAYP